MATTIDSVKLWLSRGSTGAATTITVEVHAVRAYTVSPSTGTLLGYKTIDAADLPEHGNWNEEVYTTFTFDTPITITDSGFYGLYIYGAGDQFQLTQIRIYSIGEGGWMDADWEWFQQEPYYPTSAERGWLYTSSWASGYRYGYSLDCTGTNYNDASGALTDGYTLFYAGGARKFGIRSYIAAPAIKPTNPTPADDGTYIDFSDLTLSWEDGGNTDTYNVYIGLEGDLQLVSSAQEGTSYETSAEELATIFGAYPTNSEIFWRVDAVNDVGTTTGDDWNFDPLPSINNACLGSGGLFVALATNKGVYLSANFGTSFSQKLPDSDSTTDWVKIICSSDGSYIIVWDSVGNIYRSANSGTSWASIDPADGDTYSPSDIAISSDGLNVIIVGTNSTNASESCYVSTDYGATWTAKSPLSENVAWDECDICDNGKIMMVSKSSTDYFYMSFTSGSTWLKQYIPATSDIRSRLSISGDGKLGTVANTTDNNEIFMNTGWYSEVSVSENTLTSFIRGLMEAEDAGTALSTLGGQTQGDVLDDLNTLGAVTGNGDFLVGTAEGIFAYESGNTARTSLGLGTGDSPTWVNNTLTGYIDIAEIAEPATPATNKLRLYVEDIQGFSVYKYLDSGGMKREVLRDSMILVYNDSGDTILSNRVVYASGNYNNFPTIALAKSNSSTTMPAIGVTIEDIANGAYGRVMQVGLLENIDTSSLSVGDILYVHDTVAGLVRITPPSHPNLTQEIGTVLVDDASVGAIQVIARGLTGDEYGTAQNSFTIGDQEAGAKSLIFDNGFLGTLSWTPTAARTLTLPDVTGTLIATGTSVSLTSLDLTGITDGNVPYMSASGFADSPITVDLTAPPTPIPSILINSNDATGKIQLILTDINTDGAAKNSRFGALHYDTNEEPVAVFTTNTNVTTNTIQIGGGTASMNAATSIYFRTAANNTTTSGTTRIRIFASGGITIGSGNVGDGDDPGDTNLDVEGTITGSNLNISNWDDAYTHSQLTSGNPHSVTADDLGFGTDDTPTLTGLDLSGVTNGNIPYMSASGFADSVLSYDGSKLYSTQDLVMSNNQFQQWKDSAGGGPYSILGVSNNNKTYLLTIGTNDLYIQNGSGSPLVFLEGNTGLMQVEGDIQPMTDNTYYLGKNNDDTPFAWKGIILKDQGGTGKYYRLEVNGDTLQIVDLTD